MFFAKDRIKKEIYKGHEIITVKFSVDELMINNTPNVNFWTFCLLNDLVKKRLEDEYCSIIDNVELSYSEDKEKNRIIEDMFVKLNIVTI